MFSDPHGRLEPTQEHYHNAVNAAVLAMEQCLKPAYDAVTMKATDDYEDVLWAIADHPELIRTIESIFESYTAYSATKGWDFATVTGTVNGFNLFRSWPGSCLH
jgi:hypothetical protein